MRIRVVVNAGAGSVGTDEADDRCEEVAKAFAAAGAPEVPVHAVPAGELTTAVEQAARDADVVAVAGGDGSVSTAAGVLADTDVALGILPLGTFNHLAKDLAVPDGLAEAVEVVLQGSNRRIDVAELNGRTFVNNSSIGLYPAMVQMRDTIRSARGWGKVRAVPVAVWHVTRRFPTRRIAIEADGYEGRPARTPFVFIGNNRYEIGPRGVGARTEIDRGVLCLYVAKASSRRRLVRVALSAVARGSARSPELDEACAPEITVDAHRHRMLVAVDGEVTTMRTPLRYRSLPGALVVRAPAGADQPPPAEGSEPAVSGVTEEAEAGP